MARTLPYDTEYDIKTPENSFVARAPKSTTTIGRRIKFETLVAAEATGGIQIPLPPQPIVVHRVGNVVRPSTSSTSNARATDAKVEWLTNRIVTISKTREQGGQNGGQRGVQHPNRLMQMVTTTNANGEKSSIIVPLSHATRRPILVQARNSQSSATPSDVKIGGFRCPLKECALAMSDSMHLSEHVSEVHIKWLPYECDLCRGRFSSERRVRQHLSGEHREKGKRFHKNVTDFVRAKQYDRMMNTALSPADQKTIPTRKRARCESVASTEQQQIPEVFISPPPKAVATARQIPVLQNGSAGGSDTESWSDHHSESPPLAPPCDQLPTAQPTTSFGNAGEFQMLQPTRTDSLLDHSYTASSIASSNSSTMPPMQKPSYAVQEISTQLNTTPYGNAAQQQSTHPFYAAPQQQSTHPFYAAQQHYTGLRLPHHFPGMPQYTYSNYLPAVDGVSYMNQINQSSDSLSPAEFNDFFASPTTASVDDLDDITDLMFRGVQEIDAAAASNTHSAEPMMASNTNITAPTHTSNTNCAAPKLKYEAVTPPKTSGVCIDSTHLINRPAAVRRFPIMCMQCDIAFSSYENYMQHKAGRLPYERLRHMCAVCGKQFDDAELVLDHVRHSHNLTDSRTFNARCQLCPRKFRTNDQLQCHVQCAHNEQKGFRCDKCDDAFDTFELLQRHSDAHEYRDEVTCSKCAEVFDSSETLDAHKRSSHQENLLCSQDGCNMLFSSLPALVSHERVHGQGHFDRKVRHASKSSPSSSTSSTNSRHTPQPKISCAHCSLAFRLESSLLRHVNKVHKEFAQPSVVYEPAMMVL